MSLPAGFAAAIAVCLCLGCSGPGTMVSFSQGRGERLAQLLSFEARREQSAIVRRSTLYREPQLEHYIDRMVACLMPDDGAEEAAPKVVLISDPGQNAYSFPDGAIYIYVGLDMVIKAGYDPYAPIEIFEHLREYNGNGADGNRPALLLEALSQAYPAGVRLNAAEEAPLALEHYFQAIAADPLLPEPYKAIGPIHLKKGRARSATGFFESALALAPHAHDNDCIRSDLTRCITTIEGEDL